LIGGPLLLATESVMGGVLGVPMWGMLTDPGSYDWGSFCFNLVFCATTATIVSGAMAERTKFKTYCIYSLIISAIIYPIEAFWVWEAIRGYKI
jgi:Amt family ammonium transporter